MTRLFPISIAIALTALACDPATDWLESDVAEEAEERAVPTLSETAAPIAKPAPVLDVTAKSATAKDAKADTTTTKTVRATSADEPAEGAEPEVDLDADLYLKRLVIGTGVEGREPVGASSAFTAGAQDRIYAFVEVGNRTGTNSTVSVAFVKDGKPVKSGVELRVGASPRWRTWAFTRLAKEPGEWHVVVLGPKGQELGRKTFTVAAPGAEPQATKAPPAEPETPAADAAQPEEPPKKAEEAVESKG